MALFSALAGGEQQERSAGSMTALHPEVFLAVALAHLLPASFPPGGTGDGNEAHAARTRHDGSGVAAALAGETST